MHNNYFFLKHLSKSLQDQLVGYNLIEAYSQNKDELVLSFLKGKEELYINAVLRGDFSCLFFPKNRARSKKNYAFLFKKLYNRKVIEIKQNRFDRSFWIIFEDDLKLLFKMHGNRANILLFKGEELIEVFKNALKNVLKLNPLDLEKSVDFSLENFKQVDGDISKLSSVFGKEVIHKANSDGYSSFLLDQKWEYFNQLLNELEKPIFYIENKPYKNPELKLFKTQNAIEYVDPIQCINDFFIEFSKEVQYNKLFDRLKKDLSSRLKKAENYIKAAEKNLQKIRNETNYKLRADLIMANLHILEKGSSSVSLNDFYTGEEVSVPLKTTLSPQKNAENYYRKSKNQKIEIENLERNLSIKKEERSDLKKELDQVLDIPDFKTLKELESRHFSKSQTKEANATSNKPYKEFLKSGYKIWVGKNSKKNDELTLKYASKNDLWLHAKDVSGSHVVIKEQAGKTIPKDVIEYAASLAATHSKRKSESLCPVIVTQKKFVRKPKGFPPGAVKVEKEEVIMVAPIENY